MGVIWDCFGIFLRSGRSRRDFRDSLIFKTIYLGLFGIWGDVFGMLWDSLGVRLIFLGFFGDFSGFETIPWGYLGILRESMKLVGDFWDLR